MGSTTLIGDPSGKDTTRKILKYKDIKKTFKNQKNFLNLLNFQNKKTMPIFIDNYKWLGKLNYINFLREIEVNLLLIKCLHLKV